MTPFSFAAKMPASPSNCREPWLPKPRQRVRPEQRHVVVLRHQTLTHTLLYALFLPFLSGYCCRGRTKSLESSQRGLGGHFRVVVGPPAPLLAGTISARTASLLAAASRTVSWHIGSWFKYTPSLKYKTCTKIKLKGVIERCQW